MEKKKNVMLSDTQDKKSGLFSCSLVKVMVPPLARQ
jgi:hypothetical protein